MILRGKKLVLMSIPFQIDSAIDSAKNAQTNLLYFIPTAKWLLPRIWIILY